MPVVDDNGSVVGIVTARYFKGYQGGNKKLTTMVARDIMTPNPSVVKQDASVDEIISIMVQKKIELVPVIEDDNSKKLVGVVARLDILREKLNEGFLTIGKREALSRT